MKRIAILVLSAAAILSCGPSTYVQKSEKINIGYGEADAETVSYAIAKVKIDKNEALTYSTIYDYLRGRVAGVEVRPDNTIRIRGTKSLNSSNEPLFIVDGFEYNNLDDIDPAWVESIEVLKDASSSIYGSRGANGVILITLKK